MLHRILASCLMAITFCSHSLAAEQRLPDIVLQASGLNDRLVHLSHSCDLNPTESIPAADELRRQRVLHQLCGDGVAQFGPFRKLAAFFNCRTHQKAAVDDLRNAINHSSLHDPLWIIEAGEPDVIGYALKAAEPSRRPFVHVVSHHPGNDNTGDFFSWQQVLDFGVTEHQIGDQNVGLKTDISPWDWAKHHDNACVQWIWKQLAYAEQDGVVKFQTNHFDCSDAGMVYWWITGASEGGNNHATPVEIAAMLRRVQPHALRVDENFVDPIGFHNPSPVFSWKLPAGGNIQSQSAYQIVVTDASSTDSATTPLWDSGKVLSDQSAWVPYGGPPLKSRQRVSWRAKFWDDKGRESNWRNEASLEMGLLDHTDWDAQWIEMDRPKRQPDKVTILRAEFGNRISSPPKAADVTANVRRAIQRGSTPIRVVAGRLGGDPAPGEAKTLWVDFEINGSRKQVEIPENESFSPFPKITAHPGYYLRRDFRTKGRIVKARLYASALGIYEFHINGRRVGNDALSPGYTSYSERVESLTYDVTSLIQNGDNAIGALLGEGWYAGNLLLRKRTDLLKFTPKLLAQLELTYADGSTERIVTNDRWHAADEGPIRAGGLYHGEDYDASMELGDWNRANFDDSKWASIKSTEPANQPSIMPKRMPSVQVMKQMRAVKLTQPEPGRYVFDFGQNLVGVPDITMPVSKGETVLIRFAEMLERNGTLYTTNYRSARSQATYVAAEDGVVQYQPSLSFFGFRYLELSGLAAGDQLTEDSVVAKVLHTDFQSSGQFTSSHDKLNQLQSNIRWGQISNFVDIPTDCPQRDERLGWTGDAQVFLPTSFFNYDVYSFWARWLQTVRDEQTDEGEIPHTVPAGGFGYSSPGWADVVVTAPWQIYERTGDIRILRDNYEAMKKWVAVYERRSTEFIPDLTGWGDWLQPYTKSDRKGDTAQELIATAYFGRDARILHQAAVALGEDADAKRYQKLHADIRSAFSARYFTAGTTHPGANTQTACLMGLGYDLIEPEHRKRVEAILMKMFEEADRHLRTGFLGTPLLAPVFDELGHSDICYELLFKESYPSWFYSINQGATTMWERWNSYSHADGFGDASMNSFNHYAYGAIGQFMYERIAGLAPDPKHPGYKHFFIRPLIGGPLTSARAELETGYGKAVSGWELTGDTLMMEVVIPPNATATVEFPNGRASETVGAGKHDFRLTYSRAADEGKEKGKKPESKDAHSAKPLFKNSIVSTQLDFIAADDPSAFESLRFLGQGTREMPEKRNNTLFAKDAFTFEARFGDDSKVKIWVHSSFGSMEVAERYALMLSGPLGKLPEMMRKKLLHVVIHKGDETAFAESDGHFFVLYSENMETRVRNHDLEETVFHESVHATLDSRHNKSEAWLSAQRADAAFITEYAASNPTKEDLPESALFAYTLLKHPGRLPSEVETWVHKHMPNRLAFFRRVFSKSEKEQEEGEAEKQLLNTDP